MWSTAREIAEGDVVIVWLTRDSVQPITITPGQDLNGKFGNYKHSDLVGIPYGSKVASRNGKGFIHVLRPTPELWTIALPHRTQILYLADIAFITTRLAIRPGSRVLEAGKRTGSGSFTHSIARTVGPVGHVFSFEFHQARAEKARIEFKQHGMSDYVSLQHRNVCKDGFALKEAVEAVFLDLPMPWEAIPFAKMAARKDRIVRICCFSPCMEQVSRTVSALNEHGFTDIAMYETLIRPHEVTQSSGLIPLKDIRVKLQIAEQAKEDRRLVQIASSKAKKEKRSTVTEDENDQQTQNVSNQAKRSRTDEANIHILDKSEDAMATFLPPLDNTNALHRDSPAPVGMTLTQPIREVRGHTSYLTFACLLPSDIPELLKRPARSTSPRPSGPTVLPEPPQAMDEDDL
ncbi:tRNA methyltransferase complex subunit Cpd1 [Hysterangium stoloniferum]|nr:tRNA methyltransferase complex subunit Cpd1 [Hysterangium stoloniferum]